MLRAFLSRVAKIEAIRAITLLTGGTFIAQLIPLLALPFLTRIYTPADYGALALLFATTSLLAPLGTCYMELSVPIPKLARHARMIVASTLSLALLMSCVIGLSLAMFHDALVKAFSLQSISFTIYLVPLGMLGIAGYQCSNLWLVRQSAYRASATNKLVQAGLTALIAAALGLLGVKTGLIWGFILGYLGSACFALWQASRHALSFQGITRRHIFAMLKRQRAFILHGGVPGVFNTAASMLPAILINRFFSQEAAGYYMIARQIVGAPIGMVAQASGQVVLKTVADDAAHGRNHMRRVRQFMVGLGALGGAYALALWLFGPWAFALAFGAKWQISGHYAQLLSLAGIFWITASPLANVLVARSKLHIMACWQYAYFAASCGLILLSGLSFDSFIASLVGIDIALYSCLLALVFVYGKRS